MAILNFPAADNLNKSDSLTIIKSVDKILSDSQEQTIKIEFEYLELPFLLDAHTTYRNILRQIKRTKNINEAIAKYMGDSCPPHMHKDLDLDYCNSNNCNECWKEYIMNSINDLNNYQNI